MTIAQAFNEITVAHGGTPNNGGTITGAIDALNDALAGSDQAQGRTIEDAVRLLGQHIGGSSITVEPLSVTENGTYTAPEGKAYSSVTVEVEGMAYDTIIDISNEAFIDWSTSVDDYTATVTGLTVAEAKQKMEAGEDVRICVTSHTNSYGHPVYMEMPVTSAWVYYDEEDRFANIRLNVVAIDTYNSVMSQHCINWPANSTTSFIVADDTPNIIKYQA
jgi:hypothetical protein